MGTQALLSQTQECGDNMASQSYYYYDVNVKLLVRRGVYIGRVGWMVEQTSTGGT